MAEYTKQDIKKLCKGRTEEQKKVIKYFLGSGCLFGGMSDDDYEAMVQAKAKSMDFKQRALNKIGLELEQVSIIDPVHFEGYLFDDKNAYAKWGKDRKWRSSKYQISWIFFSETQVYVYQYTFNMDEDGKVEKTEEYFYQDITNFSDTSDTVEKLNLEKISCKGESIYSRKNVDSNRFALVVPGDKFYCSMEQNEYTHNAIQGMKALLRNKKNS